jgi:mono/diheme cytochrome c family protein
MKSLIAVAALLLVSSAGAPGARGDAAAGKDPYQKHCAMCHGADGKGDTPAGKSMKLRDLGSDDVQKQTDAQLIDITVNGKNKMPAYKGKLTDQQIKDVVDFIRTMKKK